MWRSLSLGVVFLVGLFALVALHPTPARADLQLCNQSGETVYAAIGYHDADRSKWRSEGWWTIAPGACKEPIGVNLTWRYIYVYGETDGLTRTWTGSYKFCTVSDEFTIFAEDNDTYGRGTALEFIELDTGSATSYTYYFHLR